MNVPEESVCVSGLCVSEWEKMLKCVMLNGSLSRDIEMLILQQKYLIWLQVCTSEVSRRKNDSKGR